MAATSLGSTGTDIGRTGLSPVVDDFDAPFPFSGTIGRVVIDVHSRRSAADIAAAARTEPTTE